MSQIQKIHDRGEVAIIDGDNMVIKGSVKKELAETKMKELAIIYDEVLQDQDDDIVCYRNED